MYRKMHEYIFGVNKAAGLAYKHDKCAISGEATTFTNFSFSSDEHIGRSLEEEKDFDTKLIVPKHGEKN